MAEAAQPIIRVTKHSRSFQHGGDQDVRTVVVFPDGCRMVTQCSNFNITSLCLWDLETGVLLKNMEGHRKSVQEVAVSRDGQLMASGDSSGELIVWNRDGESLAQPIGVHSKTITSLSFSPDGAMLASGSADTTTELWNTKTWQVHGNPINCGASVSCVRYSPSGEQLAVATENIIQIWNSSTKEWIASFNPVDDRDYIGFSLAWTPDGTRFLSATNWRDFTIREWDTLTWEQVGEPWKGHTDCVNAIAVNPTGTLVASASEDFHVRLWRLSDRQTIAMFKHCYNVFSVTFSMDGKYILSGGIDGIVTEWELPKDALLEDTPKEQALQGMLPEDTWRDQVTTNSQESACQIIAMNTTARNACINGDLTTADRLLTEEINADGNDYNSYANRSFVMARKSDWDRALQDALKSMSIQPSLTGCTSKGISLCGKRQFSDAMTAFDLAFMFVDRDLNATHLLLLIKAIALFNANLYEEAILRVQQLAETCPNADTLACRNVEAYMCVQLGLDALDCACYTEAATHFTAAVKIIACSSKWDPYSKCQDFAVLFGWHLESLWETANQNRCYALLRAGRAREALQSYRYMMDMGGRTTTARCFDWSTAFKQEYCTFYAADGVSAIASKGDAAFAASDYDRAIELYSAAIDLDVTTATVFANRSKAWLNKALWEAALIDAQKVIALDSHSYLGYQLKHAALHGAQRYDEAIVAFQVMLSKLDSVPDTQVRELRRQYISLSEAEGAVQQIIHAQLDNAPHRLFDTFTGRLCDREAQIDGFKTSTEYKELLSSTLTHVDHQTERIKDVVATYFRYVMLSHRWEGREPLLRDIQDKAVYDLNPAGGIAKLQSFCKTSRDMGYRWAWIDTCCIDQTNNVELQQSVNSMFIWYRHSALTIVYLSDVSPSSKPGALARSAWNTRGWTFQEFLAPKIALFYQKDWTLYLGDCSPNHKNSVSIMQEMGDATGIDARALVAFRPGMRGAREKLQWASKCVTTWQEDIAYSLFGIFGVNLPVIYGEKKQNALGRLLQEVVAQSGDISALNWVGRSSEFNSCLPADITLYETSPRSLPSLPEDEVQRLVSSLREVEVVELASRLYHKLDCLSAPRFANRRLHLPCITFLVTTVKRRRDEDQETYFTYDVQADGVHDLLITTKDKLMPFSARPPAWQTLLLVRPWDRCLLELPDFADDMQSVGDWTPPGSPSQDSPSISPFEHGLVDSEFNSRALRLIVRLGQPFSAFLLARQRDGEYKRIASDHDIIAQVKDISSVHDTTDVRTLEIL